MKAIAFDEFGPWEDILSVRDLPAPEPGPGEVRVKMLAAAINFGDLLYFADLYPKKPEFPQQIAGLNGAGVVTENGAGTTLVPGTLVALPLRNIWAEQVVAPEPWAIPLPVSYPLQKAAQFANVITASDLVDHTGAGSGDTVVITAGNSAVSTMFVQLAARRDIRVIAVVRRTQPGLDLRALGADEVIEVAEIDQPIGDLVTAVVGEDGVRAVVDCVGGPMTGDLLRTTSFGGQVIIFGNYIESNFEVHNFDLLVHDRTITSYGFRFFFDPPTDQDLPGLSDIAAVTSGPDFHVPVGGAFSLDDFRTALTESEQRPERGKRFFAITPEAETQLKAAESSPAGVG